MSIACICMKVSGFFVPLSLTIKASGVNLRGRTSLPIELELTKLPLKLAINDSTRMCFPCHRKSPWGKISRQ